MSDLSATLSRKIGPLPLGGWLLAVAGGVGVAAFVRSRGGSSEPAAAAPVWDDGDALDSVPGTGGAAYSDPYAPGNIMPDPYESDPAAPASNPPATNAQWRSHAVKYLIGQGKYPIQSETAISLYLARKPMTQAQAVLVGIAIKGVGPAPQMVGTPTISRPPAKPKPKPVPKPKPKPKPKPAPRRRDAGRM